jgi:hypothetical protein
LQARFPGENVVAMDIADINGLALTSRAWVESLFMQWQGNGRIRYSDLDEVQPSRSCLMGFTLFMRNVAYWELKQRRDGM